MSVKLLLSSHYNTSLQRSYVSTIYFFFPFLTKCKLYIFNLVFWWSNNGSDPNPLSSHDVKLDPDNVHQLHEFSCSASLCGDEFTYKLI